MKMTVCCTDVAKVTVLKIQISCDGVGFNDGGVRYDGAGHLGEVSQFQRGKK